MTFGSRDSGAFPRRIASAEAFREVFGVSRETAERLATYEGLVRAWQKAVNLVSPATLDDIWHRHIADSAQLLNLALCDGTPYSPPPRAGGAAPPRRGEGAGVGGRPTADVLGSPPPNLPDQKGGGTASSDLQGGGEWPAQGGKNWLDLGSGGGFPGLVLAIMLAERDPAARMTLVESDSRKAAFLREVARKTGVAVEIRVERSEKYATQTKSQIRDAITARALAPLPKLLGLVLPFFSPQTVALFPKGREAAVEVEEAKGRFDFDCQLVPSLTDREARIVIVRNLALKTEG